MTARFVRTLSIILLGAWLLPATGADAKVPDPRNSTVEAVIVGNSSGEGMISNGNPQTTGAAGFLVIVREINNTPLWYEEVEIDFSATNVRLYADQSPGTTADCARRVLSKLTGQDGAAVFTPRFSGCSHDASVVVSAEGVALATVPARSTDLDGVDGSTGLGDLSILAHALLQNPGGYPEADFDCSGGVTLADFAILARELLSGVHGAYCP